MRKVLFKCEFCEKVVSNKGGLAAHTKHCKNNPNRVDHPPIKNGGAKKGSIPWNKGLTKDVDPRVEHSEKTLKKIRKINKNRVFSHTDEFKERQRKRAKERNLGGVRQSKRIKYNGKNLGSSYELELAKSLDKNQIKWVNSKKFKYFDNEGKERTYTPDFYLVDYDVYLDPKNDFLINNVNPSLGFKDVDKIKWVSEQNEVSIIVLDKTQLDWDIVKNLLL